MPGIKKTMEEFKKGTLHSGSKKGPKASNPKQAIAIGLNSRTKAHRKAKRPSGHLTAGIQQNPTAIAAGKEAQQLKIMQFGDKALLNPGQGAQGNANSTPMMKRKAKRTPQIFSQNSAAKADNEMMEQRKLEKRIKKRMGTVKSRFK